MSKIKQDPSTAGLGSPNVEGQGTTNRETGSYQKDSSRKKQKPHSN
ncbi:YuzL family protein [Peribacillus kribbensis]|nr:YuzL family protein [Peribacillus kribbensis]